MGVSNLEKIIDSSCEEVEIEKVDVIIDGAALYYFLYFNSDPKLDQRCGGDYPGFKDEVCKFFTTLHNCGVTPYVILDGATDRDKRTTSVFRLGDKLEKAKKIETGGTLEKEDNVLPPLVKDVFIEILTEGIKGIEGIKFKVCLGEADPEVVSAANQKQCAVLSRDTDFCIFDVHKGFLYLDNFEWKKEKNGKIPAKLYTRSKFCERFKLEPALMPVFASTAGNDYSKLKDDKKLKLAGIETRDDIKILKGILSFFSKVPEEIEGWGGLSASEKRSKALTVTLGHVDVKERQTFERSIQKYDELEKTENTSSPPWVCEKVERGELTSFVISVVDQKTILLTPLVEDFSQRSSYKAAYRIRQYFYGLLTGGNITEYDRDGEEIKDYRVTSILPSSDEQKQLKLQRLHKAPEGLRRRVFEQALQVQTSDLENIPDQLKLPVCVTLFWFKGLQHHPKPETVNCLHALLLWFACHLDGPEDEFERRMKALKDEGVSIWQPRVAHAFSQWQCCMRQSLHLNQLLCSPLPEPQCARLYCGPLLHRLADEDTIKQLEKTLRGEKKELYKYLKTILKPKSTGEGSSSEEECQQLQKTEEEENSDEDLITSLDNLHIMETTLVIGDSALRNLRLDTPEIRIKCIPEATAPVIEAELKLLAKRRFQKIVIHVGSNDIQLQQFEDTKNSIESVCNFARTMSDTVAFSGPFPNETMLSLNRWLLEWCSENNVVFIDNWQTFSENPGLIEEDGIHPTLDGAALLSRHLKDFLS
ncbi:protein asteroid homolog 1-like [Oreochromis aureus]|uniref:protein asteroid homolog 1-like n=1 Tax=Oreochromis aureus TaxID=47969 RepID=UPI0019542CD8|nr:protein asteroid homolog 1-like [Oreochromis aureus]